MAEENGVDVSEQVKELELRAKQVGKPSASCHLRCVGLYVMLSLVHQVSWE